MTIPTVERISTYNVAAGNATGTTVPFLGNGGGSRGSYWGVRCVEYGEGAGGGERLSEGEEVQAYRC